MFRKEYLDYRELNEQLLAWAEAHPDFVLLKPPPATNSN